MKGTVFKGSGVALVTPMTDKGVNFDKLEQLVEFHINNSTDALIICGTTGEAPTLGDDEHLEAVRCAVVKANKRLPVIAGTGSNDIAHACMMTQSVQKLGADAVLCVTPYYNKATQKGLIKSFQQIASSADLPLILYSVPSRTGVNIAPETVKELSKCENIVAIKEASGDISQVAKIAQLCGGDIDIYSGNDDQIIPVMSLGGIGVISVLANIAPKETHDMVYAWLEGNTQKALDLQLGAIELISALFCEVNPIPVKTAMNLMGMNVGDFRLPLCTMSDKNKIRLETALKNYGLL